MLKKPKQFNSTGERIRAIGNRWRGCNDKDVAKVAQSGVAELDAILKEPDLDSALKVWATNLRALMEQRLVK